MESIKTFDSLDEAIHYRPIWPDYDLQYNNYNAGVKAYVRKQDNEGVWQLIPVITRWDFSSGDKPLLDDVEQGKQLLQVIKLFNEHCYRVLLLYKFPEKGKELVGANGRPVGGEIDPSQISEYERLIPIYNDTERKV